MTVTRGLVDDPDPENPSARAMDLMEGRYVEVGRPSGAQEWCAEHPFPITVRPADLVEGLRHGNSDDG